MSTRNYRALLAILGLAMTTGISTSALALSPFQTKTQATQTPDTNAKLEVIYVDSNEPVSQQISSHYKKNKQYENLANVINKRINLPRNIKVYIKDCSVVNAFYSPRKHSIFMCNEFTKLSFNLFKGAKYSDVDAVRSADKFGAFVFFHEVGHMLINELQLPITGKEEDVADQFSAFALLSSGELKTQGPKMLIAAVKGWNLMAAKKKITQQHLMDEHSLDQQRVYSLLCTLYVSDPDQFAPTVGKLGYTSDRLRKCRQETKQISRAWNTMLKPYFKNQELSNPQPSVRASN